MNVNMVGAVLKWYVNVMPYFFPGLFIILFSHFCSFTVVWGLRFWRWGLGWIGLLGLEFSDDWLWGLWCGAFWGFYGLGLSI